MREAREIKQIETEIDKWSKYVKRNTSGGNKWQKMDREMKR